MTNEELINIVQRAERAALLIGQVHGKLHNILQKNSPVFAGEVRGDLMDLFHFITQEAATLYYPEVKDENITN